MPFSLAFHSSMRHIVRDAARILATCINLESVILLLWSFDQLAAPPQTMQKSLLLGTLSPAESGMRKSTMLARNTTPPSRTTPQDVIIVSGVGCNSSEKEGCDAYHWICQRCTLLNDKRRRRKCEACRAVDPSRPIKRARFM